MSKIIYLIGAGASHGVRNDKFNGMSRYVSGMPVMNEIADCLTRYCEYLQPSISIGGKSIKTHYPLVYGEMTWLRDIAKNNNTVDTYAMKLSKTGQVEELKRLKKALAIFFSLIQSYDKRDKRYEGFMSSVADNLGRINSNISVFSWNYDRQFEYALHDFEVSKTSSTHQLKYSNISCKNLTTNFFDPNESNIVKLNGTASFKSKEDSYLFQEDEYDIAVFERLLRINDTNWVDGISYAWEENDAFFKKVLPLTSDTETLVIIGYSLPVVNARIDKMLIEQMHNLKSVVIQDLRCKSLTDRLLELLPDEKKRDIEGHIKLIKEVDSFYIPVAAIL